MVEIDGVRYYKDQQGRLLPEKVIKPIDSARDALVAELIAKADEMAGTVAAFRLFTAEQVEAFIDLSLEKWGVVTRKGKGNIALISIDGSMKVEIGAARKISFDEQLQAAKDLIDSCIRRWSDGARPELVQLIAQAFEVDRTGQIRTDRVLGLRKLEIEDVEWQQAMAAIDDSITITGTREHIRFYRRDESGKWQQINLDFSRF